MKMANWKYYTLSVVLYLACVVCSIFVNNLGVVFDLVGAFGLALTGFFMPGYCYLLLLKNPKAFHEIEGPKMRKCNIVGSYILMITCIINIGLVVASLFVD